MRDDLVDQVRADLDLAEPGIGLYIGNPQTGAARIVETDFADSEVA
jgi:hypothetical protein